MCIFIFVRERERTGRPAYPVIWTISSYHGALEDTCFLVNHIWFSAVGLYTAASPCGMWHPLTWMESPLNFFKKTQALPSGVVAGHSQAKRTQMELLAPPSGFLPAVLPVPVFRFCAIYSSGHLLFLTCPLSTSTCRLDHWQVKSTDALLCHFFLPCEVHRAYNGSWLYSDNKIKSTWADITSCISG